jgi:hypothetical protein
LKDDDKEDEDQGQKSLVSRRIMMRIVCQECDDGDDNGKAKEDDESSK